MDIGQALAEAWPANSQENLAEISDKGLLALVFIRHSGCTFCREHLACIAAEKQELRNKNIAVAIVGMSPLDDRRDLAQRYGVDDLLLVSDPERRLYRSIGLKCGSWGKLLGPRQIWHALKGSLWRYGLGKVVGNPMQLQGSYLISKRKVIAAHPAQSAEEVCLITPLTENISGA
jgi:hypothetical protein